MSNKKARTSEGYKAGLGARITAPPLGSALSLLVASLSMLMGGDSNCDYVLQWTMLPFTLFATGFVIHIARVLRYRERGIPNPIYDVKADRHDARSKDAAVFGYILAFVWHFFSFTLAEASRRDPVGYMYGCPAGFMERGLSIFVFSAFLGSALAAARMDPGTLGSHPEPRGAILAARFFSRVHVLMLVFFMLISLGAARGAGIGALVLHPLILAAACTAWLAPFILLSLSNWGLPSIEEDPP